MIAALSAAECGAEVVLFERQARVGRKLAATGNGRCNITNLNANAESYRGTIPTFARFALESFNAEDALNYFRSFGLLCISEDSGRCYPYSDTANSVVDILRFALDSANVQTKCAEPVRLLERMQTGFRVFCEAESVDVDRVIVACGGQAGAKLGGVRDGYTMLEHFGHSCTKLRPALVQLKTAGNFTRALKGVRANCEVQVIRGGKKAAQSSGELQFTEYGLSGPIIFDLSLEARMQERSELEVDFLPIINHAALMELLLQKVQRLPNLSSDELFTGLLQNRLGKMLVKECAFSGKTLKELTQSELFRACGKAKKMTFSVTGDLGFDAAQVTSGGISVAEFDDKTMESRLCKGLYACGEVLDIDGPCGGYNLQWAWASGRAAGLAAGGGNNGKDN